MSDEPRTTRSAVEDHGVSSKTELNGLAPPLCEAAGNPDKPGMPSIPPVTTGGAATSACTDGTPGRTPSMHDLMEAWREKTWRPRYAKRLKDFEKAHKCRIKEEYMAEHIQAGVVLASTTNHSRYNPIPRAGRSDTTIFINYDSGIVDAKFAHVVMSLRQQQREGSILLKGKPQDILVQNIYTVLVYLLNVLDWTNSPHKDTQVTAECRKRLEAATESAAEECRIISEKVKRCAERVALTRYLIGLPVGFIVAVLLVGGAAHFNLHIGALASNSTLSLCLTAGAVGALLSVLARVTRQNQLRVRTDLGTGMTVLAGSCRPIVGAMLGAALYLLIIGGLVPLGASSSMKDPDLFYAGVAFFAGFSERWAQDTIVRNIPEGKSDPQGVVSGQKH